MESARPTHHAPHGWRAMLLLLLAAAAACARPALCKRLLDKPAYLERLTVFGDSNSDAGDAAFANYSFYKQTKRPATDYSLGGRFSGGFVWTDYVNDCIPVVQSYAVGFGTMCGSSSYRSLNPDFPACPVLSVEDQIAAYIAGKKSKPQRRATLLWAGPNDLSIAFFTDGDGPLNPTILSDLETNPDAVINGVIDCTANHIETLRKNGERNFIVLNMQPLELSVLIRTLNFYVPQQRLPDKINGYVTTFNERLAQRLAALAHLPAGIRIDLLDIHTPIMNVLTGVTPVPGITDLFNLCLPIRDTFSLLQDPTPLLPDTMVCSNREQLANWDTVHLNSVVHEKVIAKTVIDFLKDKGYISGCAH